MRKWRNLVLSAVLAAGAAGGAAVADETVVSYPSRTTQINKHFAFVDLYLAAAMNNAKALSTLGDADSGKMDAQLIAEARRNLDAALDRAQAHLKPVREYRSDLTMTSPGVEPSTGSNAAPRPAAGADRMAKLDELDARLRDARTASKKLAGVTLDELAPAVDGVATHLVAAHQSFRDIAKWTSYTLLEDSNLATVPVKGQGDERGPTPPSSPDRVTPSAPPTDDDKAKGKTIPGAPNPEPVQPAPGGR